MSGTSLDGVDVVLVQLSNKPSMPLELVSSYFEPYPESLRTDILALQDDGHGEIVRLSILGNQLAKLYAYSVEQLLKQTDIHRHQILAIGSHGQTIRHQPQANDGIGFTWQIGNSALLAELTQLTVVSDFRTRDIVAGGQGAPLVPIFHQFYFSNPHQARAIINIGGIANITYLEREHGILGFDTGPGNMLLDMWTQKHLQKNYDENGLWASTGSIQKTLLAQLLRADFFQQPIPKSTGRDLFNATWLQQQLANTQYAPQDIARTLLALTTHSIHRALRQYCPHVDGIYLCGGGAHNTLMVQELRQLCAPIPVETTRVLGITADWVEATAFAWFALQCLQKKPLNLSPITGAKGPRILGAVYYTHQSI